MPTRSRWGRGGHVEVGAIVALQRTETRAEAEISAVANLPRVVLTQAMTACGGVDLVDRPNDSRCALTEYGHSARASHSQAPSTHVRDGPVIEMACMDVRVSNDTSSFLPFCSLLRCGRAGRGWGTSERLKIASPIRGTRQARSWCAASILRLCTLSRAVVHTMSHRRWDLPTVVARNSMQQHAMDHVVPDTD